MFNYLLRNSTFLEVRFTSGKGSGPIREEVNSLEKISKYLSKKGVSQELIKKFNIKAKGIMNPKFLY